MLFRPALRFTGLPAEGFQAFAIRDREQRRQAIIDAFHPSLRLLGEDLLEALTPLTTVGLHAHVPRLDWPQGYQPFCTWLAISADRHGYRSGPQLNVGVHPDHVAVRLGWDTHVDAFGRFEFLCRFGGLGEMMAETAARHGYRFRVYASAPWPEGSRRVFESADDWAGSFAEVRRRGVWWEVGLRFDLPEEAARVRSSELGRDAVRVLATLLPSFNRIVRGPDPPPQNTNA